MRCIATGIGGPPAPVGIGRPNGQAQRQLPNGRSRAATGRLAPLELAVAVLVVQRSPGAVPRFPAQQIPHPEGQSVLRTSVVFLEAPPERSDTRERQDLQEQRRNIGETASPATTRASTSRCRAMPSPASPGKPSRGAARSRSNNVFRHRGEGDLQRRWAPRERPSGGPIVRFRGAAFRKVRRREPGRPFTSPRCPFPGPPRPPPGEATP